VGIGTGGNPQRCYTDMFQEEITSLQKRKTIRRGNEKLLLPSEKY
jgi:hypothetical protein